MKLIELHILQSFPVACLNRDDVGSPKTALFGGVNRSRISSQCMKRAIREYAQSNLSNARFNGQRTRLIIEPLQQALEKYGLDSTDANKYALETAEIIAGVDKKSLKEGKIPQLSTLIFISPAEIDGLAKMIAESINNSQDYKKKLEKSWKSTGVSDAADIAIFGRMLASCPSMNLEGAAMFSHALSTHSSTNEIDFYTAVDDCKAVGEQGAGMIGALEFSSAVYYRYCALNLDLLLEKSHLGQISHEEQKVVIDSFIRSVLMAVPNARKNSMNASTLPAYVLGVVKTTGQPIQLINAFETPIIEKGGLIDNSIQRLKDHHESLKKIWDIKTQCEVAMPDSDLSTFCSEILKHV